MCIPCIDTDCDGDPDCLCLPLMCILGYCCCKDCGRSQQQPQATYIVPGPGYAYPGGPTPYPGQPGGYYPSQFVPHPGFQQPCFPNPPGYAQPFPPQAYPMNMK